MHLGLQYEGLPTPDHYTEGVVQVMMDAVLHHSASVDAERLFSWHGALFPTGRSGLYKITVAAWRQGEEAMQVVSGPLGHQKVHYEAPETQAVPQMMEQFILLMMAMAESAEHSRNSFFLVPTRHRSVIIAFPLRY